MSLIKLSIIIPCYNLQDYVGETLKSCIDQDIDFNRVEIICVDDGSVDNTLLVLKEFAEKYWFIRVVEKENGGVSSTRNVGIENATGDFVWFIDGDDLIKKNCLKDILEELDKNSPDIIKFNMSNFLDGEVVSFKADKPRFKICRKKEKVYNFLLSKHGTGGGCCSHIYNLSLIKKNYVLFNENIKFSEDVLFDFEVVLNSNVAEKTKYCFYYYRQRKSSAIHSVNYVEFTKAMENLMVEYDRIYRKSTKNQHKKVAKGKRDRAVQSMLFSIIKAGDENLLAKKIKELREKNFYPYKVKWESLFHNRSIKQFVINLASLFIPFEKYCHLLVKYFSKKNKGAK